MDVGEGETEILRHAPAQTSPLYEVYIKLEHGLKLARQLGFNLRRNFVTVDSMAVADDKQMEAALSQHVRHQRVRILVHLVWVARLVPLRCGEGKLGYRIEAFLFLNCQALELFRL